MYYIINIHDCVIDGLTSRPTQDELDRLAAQNHSSVLVLQGRDTGLRAKYPPTNAPAPATTTTEGPQA